MQLGEAWTWSEMSLLGNKNGFYYLISQLCICKPIVLGNPFGQNNKLWWKPPVGKSQHI